MTTVAGGSDAQRALLEEILVGLGSNRIDAIELTSLEGRGEQLFVRADDLRTRWEARLVATAFTRRSAEAGLPKVAWLAGRDGGSTLESVPAPPAPLADSDVEAFRKDVEAAAGVARLEPVDILRPQAHAFALRLRVVEPHAYLRYQHRHFLEAVARWRERCDGIYTEVVDEKPVNVFTAGWYRHGGFAGTRGDVACCAPDLGLSRGIDEPPRPRCPVFDA
jgi:hypothetical protein